MFISSSIFLLIIEEFSWIFLICFHSNEFPVSQPIPKLSAKLQASGEAKYTGDIDPLAGTLYAAIVTSTMACATIG